MDAPLPSNLCDEWEKFLSSESRRPVGEDVYHEIFDHPLLFPLQRRYEMDGMMWFAKQYKPKVVCEIGADKGGSFYHWVKSIPSVKKAIAIEIRGTPYIDLFKKAFPGVSFLGCGYPDGSRSKVTIESVESFLGTDLIDCLFIDGDKCGFMQDYEEYLRFMAPGGTIFFHDINPDKSLPHQEQPPPVRVFEKLQQIYGDKATSIIDTREYVDSKERESLGHEPRCPHERWLRFWGERSCGVGIIQL